MAESFESNIMAGRLSSLEMSRWMTELNPALRTPRQDSEPPYFPPDRPMEFFIEYAAAKYISSVRVPATGLLNPDMTANAMGVAFARDMIDHSRDGSTTDIDNDDVMIHLAPGLELGDNQTFAHEAGHVFLERIAGAYKHDPDKRSNHDVEIFCDLFARHMALPVHELRNHRLGSKQAILELMAEYRMELSDVVLQLMEAKKLPKKVIIDSRHSAMSDLHYSERIIRQAVCYGCTTKWNNADCDPVDSKTPIFDFTDYAFADQVTGCAKLRGFGPEADEVQAKLEEHDRTKAGQLFLFYATNPVTD
jgi:Zn-dependent peptidase ImmA (M78 family)